MRKHPGDTQEAPEGTQKTPRHTQEAHRRHPGDTQETPRGHPGVTQRPQETSRRHAGGTQETPRRHPGDTQETPRRHPGTPRGTKGSRSHFEVKSAKAMLLYSKNGRDRPFRVDGSDVTLTVPAACAQERESTKLAQSGLGRTPPFTKTVRAPIAKDYLGNKSSETISMNPSEH